MLKQQVLDLNDKFDYFVCMMLKAKNVPVDSIASNPDDSHPGSQAKEHSGLVDRFKEFEQNAYKADLGCR